MLLAATALSTKRGYEKLVLNGRTFRREKPNALPYITADRTSQTTCWVCCSRDCRWRLKEKQAIDPISLLPTSDARLEPNEASHGEFCFPDDGKVARERGIAVVRQLVLSGSKSLPEATSQVVSMIRREEGDREAASFQSAHELERNVNRFIEREFGHSPGTYDELTQIPFELGITKNDEPFLLVFRKYFKPDSTECGVILAFATTSDLRKLFQATHGVIIADGTFNIKPHPYAKNRGSKVFTLNTLEGTFPSRRMFRRLLALLPCKSEHCYYTFLWMMIEAAVERGIDLSAPGAINWRRLMCDFELGIHNAFCDVVFNFLLIVDFALEYCHMHFAPPLLKISKLLDYPLPIPQNRRFCGTWSPNYLLFLSFLSTLYALFSITSLLIKWTASCWQMVGSNLSWLILRRLISRTITTLLKRCRFLIGMTWQNELRTIWKENISKNINVFVFQLTKYIIFSHSPINITGCTIPFLAFIPICGNFVVDCVTCRKCTKMKSYSILAGEEYLWCKKRTG